HCCMYYIFFFSSRRRHTRFSRDWSSDVCSSDLALHGQQQVFTQFAIDRELEGPGRHFGQLQRCIASQLQRPVAIGAQAPSEIQRKIFATQAQRPDRQAVTTPVGTQLQALQLLQPIEPHLAYLDPLDAQLQRQLDIRQAERLAGGRFVAMWKDQVDLAGLKFFNAERPTQQTARRPGQPGLDHLHAIAILFPEQPFRLPAAGQPPLELLHLQPWNLPQHPAATSTGAQQYAQRQDHQQHQCQRQHQRPGKNAQPSPHSSGPMEKCRRTPPSPSSAWARSTRIGPTGDTQRTPKPTLLLSVQTSSELKELPWS